MLEKKIYDVKYLFLLFVAAGLMLGLDCRNSYSLEYQGAYTISNTADLEAFSDYTEITGTLTITKGDGSTLEELSGLEGLTWIGGNLNIWNIQF